MTAHPHLAAVAPAEQRSARAPWPIRVVLADDHSVMRRTLRSLLDGEEDVNVVAEAADLASVIRDVHAHVPHVLVLDLGMPDGSSIETIRRLHDQVPETRVVVLTMETSPLFAQRALAAGAVAFVLKDRADGELVPAVRATAGGDEYISPRLATGLEALQRALSGDGLTPRETEVLRLIALGHTSAEIAGQLRLSRRTVETHRARIQRWLGMRTRAELVRYALTHHLIGT